MNIESGCFYSTSFNLLSKCKIEELKTYIDMHIAKGGETAIREVNSLFSVPANLSFLLQCIMNNDDLLQSTLDESYYHENGFHKLVILHSKNFKLRMHHFGNTARIPMENVHDHRWAFASTILSGELKMRLFEVNENDGEPVIHYKYDSNKLSGQYETIQVGKTNVKQIKEKTYKAGEQYFMGTTDLHRIINQPFEESITLILTGMPISDVCNLYATRPLNQVEKTPEKYKRKVLVQMLKSLTQKIYPQFN